MQDLIQTSDQLPIRNQRGFGLVEVVVGVLLLGIVGLSVVQCAIASLKYQKYTQAANSARNLAISKAEQLSGIRIETLNDAYDLTEASLPAPNSTFTYQRVTDVTVNADGSRTITVTVSSTSGYLTAPVSYTTRFSPWES